MKNYYLLRKIGKKWLRYSSIASIAAISCILFGLIIIFAWHNRITSIVQVLPHSPPTRYNTALMFLGSGLALLIIQKWRRSWAILPSILVMSIAVLTLCEYIFDVDLGIDLLFMDDYITKRLYDAVPNLPARILEPVQQFFIAVKRPFPGRPSPNASLAFTFVGIALCCLSAFDNKTKTNSLVLFWRKAMNRLPIKIQPYPIAPMLAAGVIGIGTVATFGYLTELTTAYAWRYLTGMSIPTSIGLLILGIGIESAFVDRQDRDKNNTPFWFPASIGFGIFTGSIFLWHALISWNSYISQSTSDFAAEIAILLAPVANIVLIGGIALSWLMAIVLHFARNLHDRAAKIKSLNRNLDRTNSLLTATLEATADGILVLDRERNIVLVNDRFNKIWRVSEEIIALTQAGDKDRAFAFALSQVKNPEQFLAATEKMMIQMEKESIDIIELKDGRILKRYARPQWFKNRVIGKVLSYRDITDRTRAEVALRQSEARFHAFMNGSPTVAFMKDEAGRYVYVNETLERIFNVKFADLQGKTDFDWLPSEVAIKVRKNDLEVMSSRRAAEYLETVPNADGSVYYWLTFKFLFEDSLGNRYVGGVAADITDRQRMEEELFQEKELAQVTLDSIGDAVITTNAKGEIEYLNPVAELLTAWKEEEARGLSLDTVFNIIDETNRQKIENPLTIALSENRTVGLSDRAILLAKDRREIAIEDSAAPIRDRHSQVVGAVMVFHDVTQKRNLTRQLSWQASHDPLTGLVNRREFEQVLQEAIMTAEDSNTVHALCYLDLDRFKIVNDTCGHIAGDELLRQLTALLQQQIRKTDILARLGGDEFGLLLHQCSPQQAMRIANSLREEIQSFRFIWQDNSFSIGVSIGLVEINAESDCFTNIIIAADTACYAAKNNGRNRLHVFQSDDSELLREKGQVLWVTRIRKALEENRFCLYSQTITPITENERQKNHYEILLRLRDEKGDLIPPAAFIPAAERYNLMHEIDRWVITTIFRNWSLLQQNQSNLVPSQRHIYAINLSGASINDDRFIAFLYEQFSLYPVLPELICFEVTETVAIANLTKAYQFIRQLQDIGCRFALDDFGSGMSSFAYLKNLPVNYLKIDGSFVKDILQDPADRAMVTAIAQIGRVMGLETIAEFVENEEILDCLRSIGVDYAQGYGIAKPHPLPI